MNPAYRIPLGKFPLVARFTSQETAANTPITEMVVNSLITSHADGAQVKAGSPSPSAASPGTAATASATVEVSTDGGKTWQAATLGEDLGRFAFRTWSFPLTAQGQGHGDGARQQRHRPDPDAGADPQSGRLSPQRHSQRRAERGLRENIMRTILIAVAAAMIAAPRRRR